jgi:hypothetical protein
MTRLRFALGEMAAAAWRRRSLFDRIMGREEAETTTPPASSL